MILLDPIRLEAFVDIHSPTLKQPRPSISCPPQISSLLLKSHTSTTPLQSVIIFPIRLEVVVCCICRVEVMMTSVVSDGIVMVMFF